MLQLTTHNFSFVSEDNLFLRLFPHRWDFIWAPHTNGKPLWNTNSQIQLTDRTILKGEYLYGVRFGPQTDYFLFDIDAGSPYHPKRDPLALRRLLQALEPLGITDHIACTSSYSGGIHIYFPLPDRALTWQLAQALLLWVTQRGFLVGPGILEILPNDTQIDNDGNRSNYQAHRLPLQEGSYLLNSDWELIWGREAEFLERWHFCSQRNELNQTLFRRVLKEVADRNSARRLSHPAQKFLNDLNVELETGWTGRGQTNFLLGRITLRAYVFGHFLKGQHTPLTGDRLVEEIVRTAQQLPGYESWCRHQHEIYTRAEEWARCIENCPRYFPYGRKELGNSPAKPIAPTWNQLQREEARVRLRFAIADLLNREELPANTRARFDVLCQYYGFSGETLYHHRDLWHPESLWKSPPDPPSEGADVGAACSGGAPPPTAAKLIDSSGCNTAASPDWRAFQALLSGETGCNTALGEGLSRVLPPLPVENSPDCRIVDKGGGGGDDG